jgi:DNA recombination protein RmuC
MEKLIFVSLVSLGAGALITFLILWRIFRQQYQDVKNEVLEARIERTQFEAKSRESQIRTAELETILHQERQQFSEKLTLLEQAKTELSNSFQALSAQALERNNRTFLDLAKSTFDRLQENAKGELKEKQQAIHELLTPIRTSLSSVDQKLESLEKTRISTFEVLRHQIHELAVTQKDLRLETANLVKALKTPHIRGRWGEMQLRRVVEMSGMSSHCDFVEQNTIIVEDTRFRPDMIINLPGGKKIVIDAKAPLAAYLASLETSDESQRQSHLKDHARQVRSHIQELSQRSYWDQFKNSETPEFVILFLPGETFFSAALEQDPTLIEMGVEKKVMLATPSTLIALLHAIAYGWRQESLAENAREISQEGRNLYKRLCDMGGHFSRLGQTINGTVKAYNSTVASLESRVLPSARRLKSLEVANSLEEIPVLSQVESVTREVQTAELKKDLQDEIVAKRPHLVISGEK